MTNVGGLNYTIRVKDEFHEAFKRFRKDMADARKNFRQFKADMRGDVVGGTGGASPRARKNALQQVQNRINKGFNKHEKDVEAARAKEKAFYKERARIETQASSRQLNEQKKIKAIDQEVQQARTKFAKKLGRIRKTQMDRRLARMKRVATFQQITQKAQLANIKQQAAARIRTARRIAAEIKRTERVRQVASRKTPTQVSLGNRISFTFRRLIGIFAVFQAVRTAIAGFKTLITEAIRLNASIQSASLGMAAIIASTSIIRDEFGNLVTGAKAFEAATKISVKQIRLLRIEGLKTSATFGQLLPAFQSALAPGREAGLSPTQIRKLAISIAQATAATGLPQNQLDEEIRSIIGGTATAKNTRLAQALGGAKNLNKRVREAKEAGKLFEFLSKALATFSIAGERAMTTFTGALSNAKDAILLVVQAAGTGFFQALTDSFLKIRDAVRGDNQDTTLGVNPRIVRALVPLFDQLAAGVRNVTDAFLGPGRGGFSALGGILNVVGVALRVAMQAVAAAVIGIGNGLSTVLSIYRVIIAGGRKFVSLFTDAKISITDMGASIVEFLATWKLLGLLPGPAKWLLMIPLLLDKITRMITGDKFGFKAVISSFFATILTQFNLAVIQSKMIWNEFLGFIGKQSATETAKKGGILAGKFVNEKAIAAATQQNLAKPGINAGSFAEDILAASNRIVDILNDTKRVKKSTDEWRGALFNARKELEDTVALTKNLTTVEQKLSLLRSGLTGSSLQIIQARTASDAKRKEALSKIDRSGTNVPQGAILSVAEAVQLTKNMRAVAADERKVNQAFDKTLRLTIQTILLRLRLGNKDKTPIESLKASAGLIETKPASLANIKRLQEIRSSIAQMEFRNQTRILNLRIRDLASQRKGNASAREKREIDEAILQIATQKATVADKLATALAKTADQAKADRFSLLASQLGARQSTRQKEQSRGGVLTPEEQAARLKNFEDVKSGKTSVLVGGITEAFIQLQIDLPNAFGIIIDSMKSIVQGFGDFVSTTIVDAFDPTKDGTILERFGRFLQGIAKQIISMLIQVALTKSILGLGGLFGGGGSTPNAAVAGISAIGKAVGGFGFNDGGIIQGFAGGGLAGRRRHPYPRPGHLHPSDNIPIFVGAGEAITRKRAVDAYGPKFMRAINEMKLDPGFARAMVDNISVSRIPAAPKPGYVAGGEVVAPATTSSLGAGGSQSSGPAPAFIVANDQTAERILAGGRNAFLNMIRDNRDSVKQSLGLRMS